MATVLSNDEKQKRRQEHNATLVQALLGPLDGQPAFPEPCREYLFHPSRRWRLDLAWPDRKVAVELEGGVYFGLGRHTRAVGYEGDCYKYSHAAALGWRVLRFTYVMVRRDIDACRELLRLALRAGRSRAGRR